MKQMVIYFDHETNWMYINMNKYLSYTPTKL